MMKPKRFLKSASRHGIVDKAAVIRERIDEGRYKQQELFRMLAHF
jgi:hypothetical protein